MLAGVTVHTVTAAIHRAPEIGDEIAPFFGVAEKIFGDTGDKSGGEGNHWPGHRHDGIQQGIGDRDGINAGFRC